MHGYYFLTTLLLAATCDTVTIQQFEQSLDMMRNGCIGKFKLTVERVDQLRQGNFRESEDSQDLKCYTKCVAQLAGTVTKKGEFSVPKALAQVPIIIPEVLQDITRQAIESCKDTQQNYKESCDKIYHIIKCMRDFDPPSFKFP